MKLQTQIHLEPEENQIDYSSKILLLGSCFSENIGAKFDYFKFQNLQNPFGIIFNPISIEKLVIRAIDNIPFSDNDIFQHNEIWKCFQVHSELSSICKIELLDNLNSALNELRESLLSSTHIIFTFGTSWVYRNIESDEIVANCHKLPQKSFIKQLLSIDAISESIQKSVETISTLNPKASIIITVSPVRHIKDGFIQNSLSKAHLIAAIHEFIQRNAFPNRYGNENRKANSNINRNVIQKSSYFPSYEIMMDELRDYRFYSEDLLHPNKTAIEIIWMKFSKMWISAETEYIQKEIATIQSGLLHRPQNPESKEHKEFVKNLAQRITAIQKQFPHITFN